MVKRRVLGDSVDADSASSISSPRIRSVFDTSEIESVSELSENFPERIKERAPSETYTSLPSNDSLKAQSSYDHSPATKATPRRTVSFKKVAQLRSREGFLQWHQETFPVYHLSWERLKNFLEQKYGKIDLQYHIVCKISSVLACICSLCGHLHTCTFANANIMINRLWITMSSMFQNHSHKFVLSDMSI